MPAGQSFRKVKRDIKEETRIEDAKHCRKKNGCFLKKRLSTLNFFSGPSKKVIPQEKNLLFEDQQRGLQRKESKKLKMPREETCSLRKPHSGKMCPKCEISICSMCNTLHTESSFIAHSLLDHYDQGRHSCSSDSGFPQEPHVCMSSPGQSRSIWLMSGLVAPEP
ncbi:uncharacterized protein LOC128351139 isoform X2 [Hemicordylus capensis]|nr:uncharacterized protein LOC128351139 isoform X2 [Hemicordylus capensis]